MKPLPELPKVGEIEISIASLKAARDALDLQILHLEARLPQRKPRPVPPLIDPRTGEPFQLKSKRGRRRKR